MDNIKWYNKDEVSNIIGISKPTLDRWVRDNKMGSYKVGRRVLFTEDNIKVFMATFKRGI
jgi:excisionase family DNA binding protein